MSTPESGFDYADYAMDLEADLTRRIDHVAALEAENARLRAALGFYMRGHPCRATNECPSKNAALAALERADVEVRRHRAPGDVEDAEPTEGA